uniref:BRCA1-associated protein n=1 Tax=Cacopsylla melanoneura TaxID=428564 RepID=A0A8D8ZKI0_9HEMI
MTGEVSLCHLRFEIEEDEYFRRFPLPKMDKKSKNFPFPLKKSSRGKREIKELKVETFPMDSGAQETFEPLFTSCIPHEGEEEINFVSGNPFVEITKGILHLYKENKLTSIENASEQCQTVCILAVPSTMTCHDLLTFTASCAEQIKHIRIVRDGSLNQYMALITFRSHNSAAEFFTSYNGIPFSSLEPDLCCHLVFISRIEILAESSHLPPPASCTELPTCPVCLERMDESVDGILTILCNHSFHAGCLLKWGDTSCPVCRYVQTPEVVADNKCCECNSAESLWICLICGHVGCGRYVQGHAYQHFLDTAHCYAMQLGNNRVWDYVGDNFVHRLLQNKGDGKLVEGTPTKPNDHLGEKIDSVQLEFTYLLTSQLDSQRLFFEERMAQVESKAQKSSATLRDKAKRLTEENQLLSTKLAQVTKEKSSLEKRVQSMSHKLSQVQTELSEERQMSKALLQNQKDWQIKVNQLETEMKTLREEKQKETAELKDQLRDIMFCRTQ